MDTTQLGGSIPPAQTASGEVVAANQQPAHSPNTAGSQTLGAAQRVSAGVRGGRVAVTTQNQTPQPVSQTQTQPAQETSEEVPLEKKNRRIFLLGLGVFVMLVIVSLALLYWRLFELK